MRASVWAAEHGASSAERDEAEGANPGVRFRIHGRLGDRLPEQLVGEDKRAALGPDELKVRLAQATEIDVTDVWMEVQGAEIELSGTVTDDGERRQLEDLVRRLTGGKLIKSRLLPRNP